jgi:hypothetical protein
MSVYALKAVRTDDQPFENVPNLDEGSREVVTKIRGSVIPLN